MSDIDLVALDATVLARHVRARHRPARQLIEATLRRIAEIEPALNAFRVIMGEAALAEAERIDALPDSGLRSLPLAGVPVAIKDDTDVAGQSTGWGSDVDRGPPSHDAEIVRRLRRAGAIIIGKTNVPELTLWPWSVRRVRTHPQPVGSEPNVRRLVGRFRCRRQHRYGCDRAGQRRWRIDPIPGRAHRTRRPETPTRPSPVGSRTRIGMARPRRPGLPHPFGTRCRMFLDIAATTQPSTTFRDALDQPSSRLRIAVSTNPPPGTQVSLSEARRRSVEDAASLLVDLGHDVVEIEIDYGLASLWNSTVRLLKGAQADVASLPDRRGLEARTRSVARLGRALPSRSLRRALQREAQVADSINRVFDSADVVLTPLCAVPAPRVDDCPTRGAMRSLRAANTSAWLVPWNVTGQPALAVPMGTDDHLPTSIHLAGRPNDEATLLALAAQIEAARPFPRWSPTPPSN